MHLSTFIWDFQDLKYILAINCVLLVHAQEVFLLDNGTAHISMNRYIVRDGFQRSVNITKLYHDIYETTAIELEIQ